jgi:pyruvate/2-oxoglutarate dehydrogenase complex dihydrolipoamide acyltransferase (E2) component
MSIEIRVPGLGAGMSEGTLVEWHQQDGAKVSPGDLLYSIETEKTVTDIEAQDSGLLKRVGKEGEVYPVGELIGLLEER